MDKSGHDELRTNHATIESAHLERIDRAYRIPICLSTTTHLIDYNRQY